MRLLVIMGFTLCAAHIFAGKPIVTAIPLSGVKVSNEDLSSFNTFFQDELFQTGALTMVERGKLDKVLSEQELTQTGITDQQAQNVGKVVGAEKIVLGEMRRVGKKYQITVRSVHADTAVIVANATTSVESPMEFQKAARELAQQIAGQLTGSIERSDEKVNRKVLVLDFVNQNKMESADYLSGSIAEAMIDPLDKTGNFQTLNRDGGSQAAATLKIEKEKFYNEANATEIGKAGGAEVVVIGNFVAIGNKIQIQAKAVDVLSGRVKVSKSVNGKLDATIFDTITQLCDSMAQKMKSELPPISKREVIHLAGDRASYGGMLWRTAVLPGWGHIYGDQKRGFVYLALWLGSAGAFAWSHLNYTTAQNDYLTTKSDFDAKFSAYSSAMDLRAYMSYAFLGVTALVWADALLFGRNVGAPPSIASHPFGSVPGPDAGFGIGSIRRFDQGKVEEYTFVRFGYAF